MSKISISDESGDKKYFTIIPNYILNHSTLWDREVYIQMKRITGEDGTCWTSQRTLAKQCGISINRLKKSINYLLEHKWIKQVGKKEVITKGGVQEVNEYAIADLWKMNVNYYEDKGVSPNDTPYKGVSPKEQRGITVEVKGVSPGDDKEELYSKEEPIKEEKRICLRLSEFNNVSILEEEKSKLIERFGEKNTSVLIEELGTYLASTGKRYSSHYATLLNWGKRKIADYQKKHNQPSKYQAGSINIE
jgi:hypothetical protein